MNLQKSHKKRIELCIEILTGYTGTEVTPAVWTEAREPIIAE